MLPDDLLNGCTLANGRDVFPIDGSNHVLTLDGGRLGWSESSDERNTVRVDAFLADTAEVVNGKIYSLGIGWNTIFVRSFPAAHRRMSIAITAHVPFTDTNVQHKLEVRLVTEDGEAYAIGQRPDSDGNLQPIHALGGDFTLGRPAHLADGFEQVACFAFTLDGLRFDRARQLSWVVSIDGDEATRLPMRVQLAAQQ